jgi:hypothetical protein
MTKAPRLALLLALAVTACAAPPQRPLPLKLDYSSLGKMGLDVHDIHFIGGHATQVDFPQYAADQFHPSLEEAIHRWSDDRLVATGTTGDATVVVKSANYEVQALATQTGLNVVAERQQSRKITGHVAVEVQARGSEGAVIATAEATRFVTLPEDPTTAERQAAYNALLAGLMQDLDRNLDQAIHEHMRDFLVGSAPPMDNSIAPMAPMPPPPGLMNP